MKLADRSFTLMLVGILVLTLCALSRAESWEHARAAYLMKHPTCEACGAGEEVGLSVHHILAREHGGTDDSANLITLCDPISKGQDRTRGCHWVVGHAGTSFDVENPFCRKQAAAMLRRSQLTKGKP